MAYKLSPKEARTVWVKALRSGRFKQCQGTLSNDGKEHFCCLGVACEVFMQHEKGLEKRYYENYYETNYDYSVDGTLSSASSDLPTLVQDWLGIDSDEEATLIGMNDTEEKSFSEIADYIEGIKDDAA